MRIHMNLIIAVTAAATYFVTIDDAAAAKGQRGSSGGGSRTSVSRSSGPSVQSSNSGNRSSANVRTSGSRTFTSNSSSSSGGNRNRSIASSNSGNGNRQFASSNSGKGNRQFNSGNSGSSVRTQQFTRSNAANGPSTRTAANVNSQALRTQNNTFNRNAQNNTFNRNAQLNPANRNNLASRTQPSILSPNQRSSLGANLPRTGNTNANPNLRTGNVNRATVNPNVNGRPATNTIAPKTNTAATLAPNLRVNTSILKSTAALPVRLTVAAAGLRLGRLAAPANLVPKLTLAAPRQGFLVTRFKPFLQRHWRTAFFWIAVPTIGYLTIPERAYDRFVTYVSGPDPDYDGAVKYLAQVAVEEEGSHVVRLAPSEVPEVRHVVSVAPAQIYDQRFTPFVNRKWNSEFWTFSVPRIGTVTCPVALRGQVQELLAQSPPKYDAVLALIEEAAAADTIVEEGALADAGIETIQ